MPTVAKTSTKDDLGMDTGDIEKVKQALTDYVNKIVKSVKDEKSGLSATTTSIRRAIRGANQEAAVVNFLNKITTEIETYFKKLEQYSAQLDDVKISYQNFDSSASFGSSTN